MTSDDLDLRLMRFRSRGEEPPERLARALIEAGRAHDALEVIHLGMLGNEDDPSLVVLEGRALYEQGELLAAQTALVRAVKANPHHKEPYRWLGQVLIERGDPVRAVQVIERGLAIDPDDGNLRNALARAQRLGRSEPRRPSQPPGRASDPGRYAAPGPRIAARAANQSGGVGPALARAVRPSAALAEELRAPESASQPLPFDDEVERDDDAPTTAVEVPEEVRSWLRNEGDHGSSTPFAPHEEDDDDYDSEPTSIVPVAEELELLRLQAEADADAHGAERTIIDQRPAGQLAQPGEAEPPEQVLALLEVQGLFERGAKPAETWADAKEAPRSGVRVTRALAVAWLLALLAAVGGYYGFDAWLGARRGDAQQLLAQGEAAALDGQHASLMEAERKLREARALDPKSPRGLEGLAFVQSVRALDGAAEEFAPLRETLLRAEESSLDSPIIGLARALARPGPSDLGAAEQALAALPDDPALDARALYLAGRLAERTGQSERAGELYERAVAREPRLALASLARGEIARGAGQLDLARSAFQRALGEDKQQLRAELWLVLLGTGPLDGAALTRQLDGLRERVARGSAAEQLLAAAVRAYALLASGDTHKALAALRGAADLRVAAPEPLALFAEQCLRAGEGTLAERAARAANEFGGGAPRYQPLLAAVALQRGSGEAALRALGTEGEGVGALALARAQAALLTRERDALEHAKKELATYRATPAGRDDSEAAALLMRVDLRLGANEESLLPAARALVARAPNSVSAQLALGETLARSGKGSEALAALEPALKLAPGSADVHFSLGNALRAAGKVAEARASLERAVSIAPNHIEARTELGRLLLELGEYDAALALYRELDTAGGELAKLGQVDALLGRGSLDEAATKLAALPATLARSEPVLRAKARLEIARGSPLAAVELLAPVVDEKSELRSAAGLVVFGDALYLGGKVDAASSAYEAALELDESQVDALLGRATVAMHGDRADQALPLLARAEAAVATRGTTPRNRARLLVLQGRAELLRGQLGPARDHLARAVALPGAPADAHFWYAELLVRARDASAPKHYQKYLELAPSGPLAVRAKRALAVR